MSNRQLALMQRARVGILFHPENNITLNQLLDAVKRLVDSYGCPGCGLNGFDLHLAIDQISNPIDRESFKDLGVSRVTSELAGLPASVTYVGA